MHTCAHTLVCKGKQRTKVGRSKLGESTAEVVEWYVEGHSHGREPAYSFFVLPGSKRYLSCASTLHCSRSAHLLVHISPRLDFTWQDAGWTGKGLALITSDEPLEQLGMESELDRK